VVTSITAREVDRIFVACEAGMGSSLMCVSTLKKKLRSAGIDIEVVHKPVHSLPADAKLVVVHRGLVASARRKAPVAVVLGFSHFLNDPVLDEIVHSLATGSDVVGTS